jgi:photosystem II stability/assembly factor-like uncharacterized protein
LEASLDDLARLAAASPDHAAIGPIAHRRTTVPGGLTWTLLGPRPILDEYWSGGTDAAGRVSSLAIDPRNGNVAYLAAAQGGVWKTTDAGVSWTALTDNLSSLASGAVALDPSHPDVVYYGTGEQNFSADSFYGDGLFRSSDAGATWSKIALKSDVGSYISRVAVSPANSNLLVLGSDKGFVRTADGGATWTVTLTGSYCTDLAIDPLTPTTMYAAIRSTGFYKSLDAGVTWAKLTGGLPTTGFRRVNFALAPSNPSVLYASFVNTTNGALLGMYKTTDGGTTWTLLSGTPNYLGTQGWYDNAVVVDPLDANVCIAGGVYPYDANTKGVIRTTNGGSSWTDITIATDGSRVHPDQHFLVFGPDHMLWLANDGGVWRMRDGGGQQWVNCNASLALTQFYTQSLHPTNANFILGGTQDNGTVEFEGTDGWQEIAAGDGGPCPIEWDSPNIFYATYVYLNPVYKFDSENYLGSVTGPWAGDRVSWANGPLLPDPNTPNTLLAGTHRVWRTTTSGGSWSTLSGDLAGGTGHLRSLGVASGVSNTIYSGSSNGLIYVTTDGSTWLWRSSGLPAAAIPDIAVSPGDWQTAYLCADVASGRRVFKTTNAGTTWTDITGDLPSGIRAMAMTVDFRVAPPRLHLGTDYGVYTSSTEGAHWVKASTDLPNVAIYDIGLDTTNNYLVAATHGRSMWRTQVDITPPATTILTPVGGESWVIGTTESITWSASDPSGVDSVTLLLSRNGGMSYSDTLAHGLPNTSSYAWTVTGPASDSCRVRVLAYDAAGNVGQAMSPGDFAIEDAIVAVGDRSRELTTPQTLALLPVSIGTRGRATVRYELPAASDVQLVLYDARGRRVRQLDAGARPAGRYAVLWDGTDDRGRHAAHGLYLVELRVGDVSRTARLIFLR